MNLRKIYRGPHGRSLSAVYRNEEIRVEKKFNKIGLIAAVLCFISSILIHTLTFQEIFIHHSRNSIYCSLFLIVYQAVVAIILNKDFYHWIIKYITISFFITTVTLLFVGHGKYSQLINLVQTGSMLGYCMIVILSGFYQNPRLSLYSGCLAAAEYCILTFLIHKRLTEQSMQQLWNILALPMLSFIINGLLMFIFSRRNRLLMIDLKVSSENLLKEKRGRRISEEKTAYIARHDDLTGLPNLKSCQERLESQLIVAETRKQNFALLCIGIDSFKNINQIQGREKGDLLLKAVATRLNGSYRDGDLIYRFMGDKFLVILNDLKPDCCITDLIKKTRSAFELPFRLDDSNLKISVGGGFCTYPDEAGTALEMIKKAESAMYAAKNEGKNNFFLFNKDEQEKLEKLIQLEDELESALEKDEFYLVFQPKVDSGGMITGMESLLRWKNSELGQVPPDIFIPVAEKTGAIISIGTWVFRETCMQLKKWADEGLNPVRVSVNVSPYQLDEDDFIAVLKAIIKETGVEPEWLGIEITESVIMKNEINIGMLLRNITELGLTISIDDFGKGYSSLSRLGNYELNTLKIDKSFIDGLPDSEVSCCLVRSIIALAHNLGYNVVAEGIENEEQADFLNSCGCDSIQGYFYYKPLLPEEISEILTPLRMMI